MRMNRYHLVAYLALVFGVAVWFGFPSSWEPAQPAEAAGVHDAPSQPTSSTTDASALDPSAAADSTPYTLADISQHASADDCWVALHGEVYDLTGYIDAHPAGPQSIISSCGTDGSDAFDRERAHARPGTVQTLATYHVGSLAH